MADPLLQPQTLFPRKDNVKEAREYINSLLPITAANEANAAVNMYHNTLLHQLGNTYQVDRTVIYRLIDMRVKRQDSEDTAQMHFRTTYNLAIDHVVSYFENRLGAS